MSRQQAPDQPHTEQGAVIGRVRNKGSVKSNVGPSPRSEPAKELVVRVDSDDKHVSSVSHNAPPSCGLCKPLVEASEQPVLVAELLRSDSETCAGCELFKSVLQQLDGVDHAMSASTWLGNGGVFALCLGGPTTFKEIDGDDNEVEPVVPFAYLALNGS